jgi:beta-xylosidase
MKYLSLLLTLLLAGCQAPGPRHAWSPDLGNGRYRNPVIHADYSDPDVIRVGDTYYMTASSFSNVPGLPLLQSADMVNWTLVGHALPQLLPREVYATPQPGKGVWAPSLRYHDGKFWIFYPDPDFGIYVITAERFAGPWSAPHLLLAGQGLIDPSPLWDDDGKAYLVHAWAKSRAGFNNVLTLRRMSADGRTMLDIKGQNIVDGARLPAYNTLEGPKFYKTYGYYYIFAPAGGVETGWQAVFRSRSVDGPYEERIVLRQGASPVNGPHQGAWVTAADGRDWFFHFQDRRAFGRVVHLQPMRWKDGWPIIGEGGERDGTGQPVMSFGLPVKLNVEPTVPATSDEFSSAQLGYQWQWRANWDPSWYSLTAHDGFLRLYAQAAPQGVLGAAAILSQKFPAPQFGVTTRLSLQGADGDRAGLLMHGQTYAWLGLRNRGAKAELVLAACETPAAQCTEQEEAVLPLAAPTAYLRMRIGADGLAQFSYSLDGLVFVPIGRQFTPTMGRWVGAQVGLAAFGKPGAFADVDFFRVTPGE